MKGIYLALVHYPVKDRAGRVVTTAVTNLDVHDLARLAKTYGLSGYFVVTPIAAQHVLVERIIGHWREGAGARRVPERGDALLLCEPVDSIEAACRAIEVREGEPPRVWVTAARASKKGMLSMQEARALGRQRDAPLLILCGTGHGLAPEVLERYEALPPIRPGGYNHLSVRTAAAILLDRLFGDDGASTASPLRIDEA